MEPAAISAMPAHAKHRISFIMLAGASPTRMQKAISSSAVKNIADHIATG